MTYSVRILPAAERQLADLPPEPRNDLRAAIRALADEPRPAPPLGKKLAGFANSYRLAVGSYRVVYEVHKRELVVLVVWAGNRRDAYRQR